MLIWNSIRGVRLDTVCLLRRETPTTVANWQALRLLPESLVEVSSFASLLLQLYWCGGKVSKFRR